MLRGMSWPQVVAEAAKAAQQQPRKPGITTRRPSPRAAILGTLLARCLEDLDHLLHTYDIPQLAVCVAAYGCHPPARSVVHR